MKDIIIALKETPTPTILIVGGIFFLFIAIGGKFRTKINTARVKRKFSAVIGVFLLCSGIGLHALPTISSSSETEPIVTPGVPDIPKPNCEYQTIYDDFNDKAYNGNFNRKKWEPFSFSSGRIVQKDEILTLSRSKGKSDGIGLTARDYQDFTINIPIFMEARFMVPEAQDGHVYLTTSADLDSEDYTDCLLGYGDKQASISCSYTRIVAKEEKAAYTTKSMAVDFGSWHIVRIDIEPSTMTFTYYVDSKKFGSYVPKNAKKLKKAKFSIDIGIWGESSNPLTAYVDYVCIGENEP